MKPLSLSEIQTLADELLPLVGSQLQEIVTTPSGLFLSHYVQRPGEPGQTQWIQIEAHQNLPFLSLTADSPRNRIKTKSPLHLFLVAHARGRRLSQVRLIPELGRAVEFCWGPLESNETCRLEFRLIPSKVNLIASYDELSISWKKVSEMKMAGADQNSRVSEGRAPEELRAQWNQWNGGGGDQGNSGDGAKDSGRNTLADDISRRAKVLRDRLSSEFKKKKAALEKMRDQLSARDPAHWMKIADWIRDNWSLEVPEEIARPAGASLKKPAANPGIEDFIQADVPKTLAMLYERIKKLKGQHEQGSLRLQSVEQEIEDLERLLQGSDEDLVGLKGEKPKKTTPQKALPERAGKRLELSDSEFVLVGRSAAENLQILRDAQPWDLWLHLKDLPSAHGIIRRNRGKAVSDANLFLAIHFVLKMTPKVARHLQAGDRVEGIVAECRFVSPMKGDSLGRVSVRESRTISMKYDPQKLTRP